ncbi:hypothetical protein [Hoeflea sp. TYP-13]
MKNIYHKFLAGIVRIASILSVTRSTRPQPLPEPRYPVAFNG